MYEAVENIKNGKTALGKDFSGTHVQITRDDQTLRALSDACQTLHDNIKDSVNLKTDENLTTFITKMAAYCAKQGFNTQAKIENNLTNQIPTLSDAFKENPNLLTGKAGIAAILRKHTQNANEAIAHLRETLINDDSTPPVEILRTGDHKLVELLSPAHLQKQSTQIGGGCCVGTDYNQELLEKNGLNKGDPGSEKYLTYAVKIRSGESRIFALQKQDDNHAVATIEYNTSQKSIVQIEGKPREIKPDVPYFDDLCESLYQLQNTMNLSGGINGLPEYEENSVLLRSGQHQEYSQNTDPNNILKGSITLDETINQKEVHALCSNPNITLDIKDCSNDWLNENLPTTIRANLTAINRDNLILKYVTECNNIDVRDSKSASFPALKKVNNINANLSKNADFSALETANDIKAENSENADFSALTTANDIHAEGSENADFSALTTANNIHVEESENADLSSLTKANKIDVYKSENANFSALTTATNNIGVHKAKNADFSALTTANDIDAEYSENANFSALTTANNVEAEGSENANFSALKTANNINANLSKNADFSNLIRASEVCMSFSENADFSALPEEKFGIVQSDYAEGLILSKPTTNDPDDVATESNATALEM